MFGRVCSGCIVVCGVFWECARIVRAVDGRLWGYVKKAMPWLLLCSSFFAWLCVSISGRDFLCSVLLEIVAGSVLFACVTDWLSCEVYRFTWWIAGSTGMLLWIYQSILCRRGVSFMLAKMLMLICYLMLQELLFSRFYGRADCHAFVLGALVGSAFDMDIAWFFLHMIMAFLTLTLMQALCCNIGRRGRLKHPVAFLPYITFSFCLVTALYIC